MTNNYRIINSAVSDWALLDHVEIAVLSHKRKAKKSLENASEKKSFLVFFLLKKNPLLTYFKAAFTTFK